MEQYETGSSSSDADGYVTPDEFVESENAAPPPHCDDEVMREALSEANELKEEGTGYFRVGKWVEARHAYTQALHKLPKRKDPGKGKERAKGDIPPGEEEDSKEAEETSDKNDEVGEVPILSDLEKECAKLRSVLNGNIGACHVKLNEHKEAVAACTQALLDDPRYVKALHRRATSNELLATWSSLTAAEEDYNTLLNLLPPSSPLLAEARLALQRVAPRREDAQKAEMGEMMDKLKGLGNSFLGNFGLSTDNFKFEPNGQGGYSVNFVR